MADTDTTPDQDTPPVPTPAGVLGDAGKRAVAAERDARKAAEAEAADLRKQIEALTADVTSKTAAADSAAGDALRWRIAATKGIAAEDVELFLTAADEETLIKQADRLAARVATAVPDLPPPDPSQGGVSAPVALNSDELTNALKAAVGA